MTTIGQVSAKKYRVQLTPEERQSLEAIKNRGSHKATKYKRAVTLLLTDENQDGGSKKDAEIHQVLGLSISSIERLRKRCHEVGPLGALESKPRKASHPRKITGEVEARISALACSETPPGVAQWSVRLLAKKAVELEIIDSIGRESVREIFKKVNSNPGNKSAGVSHQKKMPPS